MLIFLIIKIGKFQWVMTTSIKKLMIAGSKFLEDPIICRAKQMCVEESILCVVDRSIVNN
jgi:hypothetical protein